MASSWPWRDDDGNYRRADGVKLRRTWSHAIADTPVIREARCSCHALTAIAAPTAAVIVLDIICRGVRAIVRCVCVRISIGSGSGNAGCTRLARLRVPYTDTFANSKMRVADTCGVSVNGRAS